MARELSAIVTLQATARLESPLHVGAAYVAVGADAGVFRDASGRLLVPGTSIAGALRAALGESDARTDRWGAAIGSDVGASRVVVRDTPLTATRTGHDEPVLGRRDGVGIDRAWGSAADGLLFGREVVPAGAWATLRIEVHSTTSTAQDDLMLIARIRQVLLHGLTLGARTSRGLGLLRCPQKWPVAVHRVSYTSPSDYWRTRRTPESVQLPAAPTRTADILDIAIEWTPRGPVMVAAGGQGTSTPRLPIVEPNPQGDPNQPPRLRIVLPGSAIAGALRSRAELICRTLRQTPTPDDLAAQLRVPLVAQLFGMAAGEPDSTASALVVEDCASTTTVAASAFLKLLGDDPPRRVRAGKEAELRLTDHVSVDRWTGGASEGRLFAEVEPHGFVFAPLRFRVRTELLPDGLREAAIALLLVTLRELAQGRVPLGGATHRGYGTVDVTGVRLTGCGLEYQGDTLDLHDDTFAALRAAWQDWISSEGRR